MMEKKVLLNNLLVKLHSNTDGLSSDDAQKRLQEYGLNELTERKVNPIIKFFKYFWGPMPWLIEISHYIIGNNSTLGRYGNNTNITYFKCRNRFLAGI